MPSARPAHGAAFEVLKVWVVWPSVAVESPAVLEFALVYIWLFVMHGIPGGRQAR